MPATIFLLLIIISLGFLPRFSPHTPPTTISVHACLGPALCMPFYYYHFLTTTLDDPACSPLSLWCHVYHRFVLTPFSVLPITCVYIPYHHCVSFIMEENLCCPRTIATGVTCTAAIFLYACNCFPTTDGLLCATTTIILPASFCSPHHLFVPTQACTTPTIHTLPVPFTSPYCATISTCSVSFIHYLVLWFISPPFSQDFLLHTQTFYTIPAVLLPTTLLLHTTCCTRCVSCWRAFPVPLQPSPCRYQRAGLLACAMLACLPCRHRLRCSRAAAPAHYHTPLPAPACLPAAASGCFCCSRYCLPRDIPVPFCTTGFVAWRYFSDLCCCSCAYTTWVSLPYLLVQFYVPPFLPSFTAFGLTCLCCARTGLPAHLHLQQHGYHFFSPPRLLHTALCLVCFIPVVALLRLLVYYAPAATSCRHDLLPPPRLLPRLVTPAVLLRFLLLLDHMHFGTFTLPLPACLLFLILPLCISVMAVLDIVLIVLHTTVLHTFTTLFCFCCHPTILPATTYYPGRLLPFFYFTPFYTYHTCQRWAVPHSFVLHLPRFLHHPHIFTHHHAYDKLTLYLLLPSHS